MRPSVLMLGAERPYPLHGGGAYRTASLLHYFAQRADVDLILLTESDVPSPVPDGLLRSQKLVLLPKHHKTRIARYWRNARRALHGIPPLIDRLSGLEANIREAIGSRRYDLIVVEHFWCAPYAEFLRAYTEETILDLHNVESALHRSCALVDEGLVALGQQRFAKVSEDLERKFLPQFSRVLVTSEKDAARVGSIAPDARPLVYPNALPWMKTPACAEKSHVVFTANFEYHPNIDAVRFLVHEIWPAVLQQYPGIRLRLVGRGDRYVRQIVGNTAQVDFTGPVADTMPELGAASVVIAPLRAGSGTRIKILEGWAAGRPVVATTLAAEGLAAHSGQNILLADGSRAFTEAITHCLSDAELRAKVGLGGRKTYENLYSWPRAWDELFLNKILA